CGGHRLVTTDIVGGEQPLSIQVRYLDVVIVEQMKRTSIRRQEECHIDANATGPDQSGAGWHHRVGNIKSQCSNRRSQIMIQWANRRPNIVYQERRNKHRADRVLNGMVASAGGLKADGATEGRDAEDAFYATIQSILMTEFPDCDVLRTD